MKSKLNNTIEFKPKDSSEYNSNNKYPLNNKNLESSSKVIPYSKHRRKGKLKSFKINKQVDKFNKFEKTHPFFQKYKPIIILFIIMLIISFITSINNKALNNSYGNRSKYTASNSSFNTSNTSFEEGSFILDET